MGQGPLGHKATLAQAQPWAQAHLGPDSLGARVHGAQAFLGLRLFWAQAHFGPWLVLGLGLSALAHTPSLYGPGAHFPNYSAA